MLAVNIFDTPFPAIVFGLICFVLAYIFYSKRIDKSVWQTNKNRPTPAKMYMDGVEYFPVSKSVLYGYQFKSVAALGPIVGPLVAVSFFGWIPSLLWIIFGMIFIGWVQDYSTMMMSVRSDGKSMGPIAYELMGDKVRKILLVYVLIYMVIITAVFEWVIIDLINSFPGTLFSILIMCLMGAAFGYMVFKGKVDILVASAIAILIAFIGIFLPLIPIFNFLQFPAMNFLEPSGTPAVTQPGSMTLIFFLIVIGVLFFIGAVVAMPKFLLPTIYVGYLPSILALVLVIIAALLTPFSGVTIQATAVANNLLVLDPTKYSGGPLWPILFVTIACGSISGWHSLVSTGLSSKQLEFETDALPVGGGAMFAEGVVALSSIAAMMVVATTTSPTGKGYADGAGILVTKFFGIFGINIGSTFAYQFFAVFVIIMGLTTSMLFVRVWRVASAELFGRNILSNKYVSPIILLIIAGVLTFFGSWSNLWIFFGGTNQLLAGLALMLVAIFLAKNRRQTWYVFYPAIFMIVTTIAAIAYETYVYAYYFINNVPLGCTISNVSTCTAVQGAVAHKFGLSIVTLANGVSLVLGIGLTVLGIVMAYYLIVGYFQHKSGEKQSSTQTAKGD